jgi:uncharacterized protein (TIGR02145 family)
MFSSPNKFAFGALCLAFLLLSCTEHVRDNPHDPGGKDFYDSFIDIRDRREYKTISIGEQVWMAENLMLDGVEKYSYWRAVLDASNMACPSGWHLPSDEEWTALMNFVGDSAIIKLKDHYGFFFSQLEGETFNYEYWSSTNCGVNNDTAYYYGFSDSSVKRGCAETSSNVSSPNLYYVRCVQNSNCGDVEYDLSTHGCDDSGVLRPKCGGSIYNPETQFCSTQDSKAHDKCGGSEYNTNTQVCNNGVLRSLCEMGTYDASAYFCDSRDNMAYKMTKIGTQVWMAENLNYNENGSKCYNDIDSYCAAYGRLYDWNAAMKACPEGWHIPFDEEWDQLYSHVDVTGGYYASSDFRSLYAGKYLKATSGWNNNGNGTDDFGFTARPGGWYPDGGDNVGKYGRWWSASEYDGKSAYSHQLVDYSDATGGYSYSEKDYLLFSVRCVQDTYEKCGSSEYNPITHFCESGVVILKCGNSIYNNATQFCSEQDSKIYNKCGGLKYNTNTEICNNGSVQSLCEMDNYFCDNRDNKAYKITTVGTQVWMAENLNYNANGSKCYNDLDSYCATYGRLYNWNTALTVCPEGWYLPTINELDTFMGINGFATLLGGFGHPDGSFGSVGYSGIWWSSTEYGSYSAYRFEYYSDGVVRMNDIDKNNLFSVRCAKD